MTWTDSDREGETYLRLLKAESQPRSEMEARQGQADALKRLTGHWEKAQSKQAVRRALSNLTLAIQLAPEKPALKPLRWLPKTGTGGQG